MAYWGLNQKYKCWCDGAVQLVRSTQGGNHVSMDLLLSTLEDCASKKCIRASRQTHSVLVAFGLESHAFIGDDLIRLFASCGSLIEATQAFFHVLKQTVYTWNAIIIAHIKLEKADTALKLYSEMQQAGIQPNKVTISSVLKACRSIAALELGRLLHDQIIRNGFQSDLVIGSGIADMYGTCGRLEEALNVLDYLPSRNVVTWGAIITGYVQHGQGEAALDLFVRMQGDNIEPNDFIFACTLKACGALKAIGYGRVIHAWVIHSRLESNVVVGSTLVDMYVKCSSLEEAQQVFNDLPNRNAVTWGAMITGFVQHGHNHVALYLFEKMEQKGIQPDKFSFSCILKACGYEGAVGQGRLIHNQMIVSGIQSDEALGNALVDMYARCGSLEEACLVLYRLATLNIVSCSAMIAGYVQHGHGFPALQLFKEMQEHGIEPEKSVFLCVLKACGITGAIRQGQMIHNQMIRTDLETDQAVVSALVEMYADCGKVEEACKVFSGLRSQNVVLWGSMIAGYAKHGNYKLVRECLTDMKNRGLEINDIIFSSILTACTHAGLLEEGHLCFKSMKDHCILPKTEHYSCMADLLGRAGCFKTADDLLQTMPMSPDFTILMSLLTCSTMHGNTELGRKCFEELVQMNPSDASGYVQMSKMYADGHMWEHVDVIEDWRRCAAAWKKPGMAWVEIDKLLHEFVVGSQNDVKSDQMTVKLGRLSRVSKQDGYVPQVGSMMVLILEEQ